MGRCCSTQPPCRAGFEPVGKNQDSRLRLPLPRAEIIAVGTELLSPDKEETNSLFITRRLSALGIEVTRKVVVGDNPERIGSALTAALETSEIVIVSGGLGPTNDDLTREAVAQTLQRPLSLDPRIVRQLEKRFEEYRLKLSSNNRRQAMVPKGAQVLFNPNGSAPGLFLREGDALVFLLPGPPRELNPMMLDQVVPLIRQHKPTTQRRQVQLRVASLGESAVDSRIESIYKSYDSVETTILSSPGLVELLFLWKGSPESPQARKTLARLARQVREELGDAVYADGSASLEMVVGRLLEAKGLTLSTAESCTGGWVGKVVTAVPGSSRYYLGGVVTYSNELKARLLDVPPQLLEREGAVSEPVAEAMARGVRKRTGSTHSLSVTGIAGPEGGGPGKPVGLVWFGLSSPKGTHTKQRIFPGERKTVRLGSMLFALDWLRRYLQ